MGRESEKFHLINKTFRRREGEKKVLETFSALKNYCDVRHDARRIKTKTFSSFREILKFFGDRGFCRGSDTAREEFGMSVTMTKPSIQILHITARLFLISFQPSINIMNILAAPPRRGTLLLIRSS